MHTYLPLRAQAVANTDRIGVPTMLLRSIMVTKAFDDFMWPYWYLWRSLSRLGYRRMKSNISSCFLNTFLFMYWYSLVCIKCNYACDGRCCVSINERYILFSPTHTHNVLTRWRPRRTSRAHHPLFHPAAAQALKVHNLQVYTTA